jgi:hypothetical protein
VRTPARSIPDQARVKLLVEMLEVNGAVDQLILLHIVTNKKLRLAVATL